MKQKSKLFQADYSKEKFVIKITVHENGNSFSVDKIDKDHKVSYQEIIGALEITKFGYMEMQREANIKSAKNQSK